MNSRLGSLLPALIVPVTITVLGCVLLSLLHHSLSLPVVQHFDHAALLSIHSLATPTLDRLCLTLTWLGAIRTFGVAVGLAVTWLVFMHRLRIAGLLAGALAGALVLNELLKVYFHRPRPHLPWSVGDESTWSFPSGHSLFAVVLYGLLAYLALRSHALVTWRLKCLPLALALPLAIGFSRIYLGMHYPTDVFAGYISGSFWLLAIIRFDRSLSIRLHH